MVNDLRVGRLSVVVVAEATADAHGTRGDLVFAEVPAGHIHLVNALVAHVPVAVSIEPMPVVVEFLPAKRFFDLSRAGPDIVIDPGRDRTAAALANGGARFITHPFDVFDFSEFAFLHKLHRRLDRPVRAALGAPLTDASFFAGELHELTTFPDIVGNGFLDVGVFACLDRPDSRESVPMVRRGGGHRIDIPLFEHFAHVRVAVDGDLLNIGHFVHSRIEDGGIGVTNGGDSHPFHFRKGVHVGLPAAIHADDADTNVAVRAEDTGVRPGEGKAETGPVFEDLAAVGRVGLIRDFHNNGETLRKIGAFGNP